MLKRTLTGIILFGIVLLILWLSSYSRYVFEMFVLLFDAIATLEMYKAMKKVQYRISLASLCVTVAALYPFCHFFGGIGLAYTLFVGVLTAFIEFIFDSKKKLNDFAVNCFLIVYPSLMLGCVFVIANSFGFIPVLFAIGAALMSDCIAYFGGSLLGKKKIFPKISPKKTYAGCSFGLLGGLLGGLLVWALFELAPFPTYTAQFTFSGITEYAYLIYMFVGILLAVIAELGDLGASRIKRETGLKDYGTLFGSHGGVMDRIDSMLFTLPIMTIIMFCFF